MPLYIEGESLELTDRRSYNSSFMAVQCTDKSLATIIKPVRSGTTFPASDLQLEPAARGGLYLLVPEKAHGFLSDLLRRQIMVLPET